MMRWQVSPGSVSLSVLLALACCRSSCFAAAAEAKGTAGLNTGHVATEMPSELVTDHFFARLQNTNGGISLSVSAEPVLLLYHDPRQGLAKTLGTPALSLVAAPADIGEGATSQFALPFPQGSCRVAKPGCTSTQEHVE